MDQKFQEELQESLYIHIPLKPDMKNSLETLDLKKDVLSEIVIWDGKDLTPWTFDGEGRAKAEDGKLVLKTGTRNNHWPVKECTVHVCVLPSSTMERLRSRMFTPVKDGAVST